MLSMTLLRRLAALARRFLRRLLRPPEPTPRVIGLYAADDNQVYMALLSGGSPLHTLGYTSAGPGWMQFTRIG